MAWVRLPFLLARQRYSRCSPVRGLVFFAPHTPAATKCGNLSGQLWVVIVTKDGDAVRLTTLFRGPGMCLDIFNGGPNNDQPHLTKCSNFSGQLWVLTKTDKRVEGGTKPD